jgi:hypothetical protein
MGTERGEKKGTDLFINVLDLVTLARKSFSCTKFSTSLPDKEEEKIRRSC